MSGRNLDTLEMATETDWVWAPAGELHVGNGKVTVNRGVNDNVHEVMEKAGSMGMKA